MEARHPELGARARAGCGLTESRTRHRTGTSSALSRSGHNGRILPPSEVSRHAYPMDGRSLCRLPRCIP